MPLRVLAVGQCVDEGPLDLPGAHFIAFPDLTEALLAQHRPDVVLSPLVAPEFDCVEVAGLLAQSGFSGRYRAFAENLPRPDMVRCEIGQSFPDLDFDVLVVTRSEVARRL